jgi:hypothetical protein
MGPDGHTKVALSADRQVASEPVSSQRAAVPPGSDVLLAREAMAQLNIDPQKLMEERIEPELLSKTYSIAAATLGVMQQQQIDGGARLQFQADESGNASIVIRVRIFWSDVNLSSQEHFRVM